MTISRRDTIVLAVLVNSALLSFLFFMASEPDTLDFTHTSHENVHAVDTRHVEEPAPTFVAVSEPALQPAPSIEAEQYTEIWQPQAQTPAVSPYVTAEPEPVETVQPAASTTAEERYVEVRVKRGDFLEKIARANGTTVTEIKRINSLASDRIDIGQILRVPRASSSHRSERVAHNTRSQGTEQHDSEYYTIKIGDNLWNIARQYHVPFDELLRINSLNEERARQLRPGDRIRVR